MHELKHKHMRGGDNLVIGLQRLCKSIPPSKRTLIVEVGSFYGESTVIFADYFEQVVAIDPWDFTDYDDLRKGHKITKRIDRPITGKSAEKCFDENIAGIENIKKIKAYDYDVIDSFENNSIDCIYIDSLHTFETCGITALRWWPKIKNDGYLTGHDFNRAWPGIIQAVKTLADMTHQKVRKYKDGSWLLHRK